MPSHHTHHVHLCLLPYSLRTQPLEDYLASDTTTWAAAAAGKGLEAEGGGREGGREGGGPIGRMGLGAAAH
jgi:hypothetical protein